MSKTDKMYHELQMGVEWEKEWELAASEDVGCRIKPKTAPIHPVHSHLRPDIMGADFAYIFLGPNAHCSHSPITFPTIALKKKNRVNNIYRVGVWEYRAERMGVGRKVSLFYKAVLGAPRGTFDGISYGVMCDNVKQTKPTKDAYFAMRMPRQTLDALRSAAENDRRSVSDFALGVLQKHLAFLVSSGVVRV